MALNHKVFGAESYAEEAASFIQGAVPSEGSMVLTGGTTAERVYKELQLDSTGLEFFFSDERCVPPDDAASNYRMATSLLGIDAHRMRGEDDPDQAAAEYAETIRPHVERGLDLLLVGMGADAHICALFPRSPALDSTTLSEAVHRPDGMKGITLTPLAVTSARRVLVIVTGAGKAETVARVLRGDEPVASCPARLLADMNDVTFLLDEAAASQL